MRKPLYATAGLALLLVEVCRRVGRAERLRVPPALACLPPDLHRSLYDDARAPSSSWALTVAPDMRR